ncbi:TIGR00266 family protein [Pseudenhygromyxa sp. WMMC2535]|uniref:TIGR00266 family protein n=1 Tax=Pseudenhygromyxa sp. WMMC2535 TaxID=2712867 RepID=UPI0015537B2E|nr:TIGR00266 family protein [Pseudenhygromyxa sp. WMMC2535]NVB37620.1 TIGR00266 family protein [Pseudenhygromyxa sp. WMMC2535]
MQHQLIDTPDFGMLQVTFDQPNETIVSEAGAMVAMDTAIKMETSMRGGLMAAAKRKLMGGESLFQNTYTATAPGQRIFIAPGPEGDLRAMNLAAGENFFLQSGAYVAHVGNEMVLDTKFGGVKGFFGGVGFFMLRITGPGTVYYCSYGALHEIDVPAEGYTIDNDHLVGFTEGLQYNVRKFGGTRGLFFSGEGLVCDFSGQGKIYLQTRNAGALAAFLHPFRPVESKG